MKWLLLLIQTEKSFESAEYGVQFKFPASWTVDAGRQTGTILKLKREGAEIVVSQVRLSESFTFGQYREKFREHIQRTYAEARILEERSTETSGSPGTVFLVRSSGPSPMMTHRGVWMRSPQRVLTIEGSSNPDRFEDTREVFDRLIATLRLVSGPIPEPGGNAAAWKPEPLKIDSTSALEIASGGNVIGEYRLRVSSAVREGVSGYEFDRSHDADFGEEGKESYTCRGFVSADLSFQTAERTYFRITGDRRCVYYEARARLVGGELEIRRKINGELSDAKLRPVKGSILLDALDACHAHLLSMGKGDSRIPTINLFDPQPAPTLLRCLGRMKVEGEEVEVVESSSEERSLIFWYREGRILRITGMAPSIVVRPKGPK
jgi:hypothetical protein